MNPTLELIKSAAEQKPEDFKKAFNLAMSEKVADTLHAAKVQLASTLMAPPEKTGA